MNNTVCSSIWPNMSTSRPNFNNQFSLDSMSTWQPINLTSELYPTEDYNNVWSPKSEVNDDNDKESFIKSIWRTNTSPSISAAETNSIGSEPANLQNGTPTNSPSIKRMEIINCNENWGKVTINQLTPWKGVELDDSDKRPHDPMIWRAKVDGTEVWEDYCLKQHGRRRPQSDSSFSPESVWSLASDLTQSTNSIWPPKNNDVNNSASDNLLQNFTDINNRSNFNAPNGVRPSMTRNQAQKYLMDMGYSLNDAINALINNQMDLPKAINELETRYNRQSMLTNGMYTPTIPFPSNGHCVDNAGMTRVPSGPSMLGLGNNLSPMMAPNYGHNYDLFSSDHLKDQQQQMLESPYMNMDNGMTQYGRGPDPAMTKRQFSMPVARDNSYRNSFPVNGLGNSYNSGGGVGRALAGGCGGQYGGDVSAMTQGVSRMHLGYNGGQAALAGPSKWSSCNGYTGAGGGGGYSAAMVNGVCGGVPADPRQSAGHNRVMAKQQQHMYQRSPSGWPPNNDLSAAMPMSSGQNRLTNNNGSIQDNNNNNFIGIIIKQVPQHHIEIIKSICFESGAMTNFQLQPQIQSIIVYFNSPSEARRCMIILQNRINSRVELINDEYLNYMSGLIN